MFEDLGARTIDADRLAHEALTKSSPVYPKIAKLFKEAGTAEGLDRKKIAEIVFENPSRRKALEAIVHPYVFQRMLAEAADSSQQVMVLEVPLLFETGFDTYCRETIVVKANDQAVNERLKKQGFSPEQIEARRRAQMALEEKVKKADVLIENSGNLETTRRQVETYWKKIHAVLKGEK